MGITAGKLQGTEGLLPLLNGLSITMEKLQGIIGLLTVGTPC